jgi:hypothetical protein
MTSFSLTGFIFLGSKTPNIERIIIIINTDPKPKNKFFDSIIYILEKMLIVIELLVTILYLCYIQFSPQIGNIWWRNDYFSPYGAYKMIIYPLQDILMWKPQFWDINFFIWIIFGFIFYLYFF